MADRSFPHDGASALSAALEIVRSLASDVAATMFEAIVTARPPLGTEVDLLVLARAVGYPDDLDAACEAIDGADRSFSFAFGIHMSAAKYLGLSPKRQRGRDALSSAFGGGGSNEDPKPTKVPKVVKLSDELIELLDRPLPLEIPSQNVPKLDETTTAWAEIIVAAVRGDRRDRGHHLLLRCVEDGPRELADFSAILAERETAVLLVGATTYPSLEYAALKVELHAGDQPLVVVVDQPVFSTSGASGDDGETPVPSEVGLRLSEDSILRTLPASRHIYVWRVPSIGDLPPDVVARIGGIIGPLRFDRAWCEEVIAAMAPGVGSVGMKALCTRIRDPRDAGALAAMANAATKTGLHIDAACHFVSRSLAGEIATPPPAPFSFDPRLIVCDEEGRLLLERASQLARNGGRVLLWGPPGGGKSSYAKVLAAAMGDGRSTRIVTPSSILARAWGATERLLAAVWKRAADDGATLIIDELDSLCGVRESQSGSGGNAYLIRTLTDEWLRHFDGNPSVPVIATVNDALAIDDAVRRRFAFVIEVRDELPPDLERLAWESVLQAAPPPGWKPCGAAVSDFTIAAAKCGMLGLSDTASLATSIVRARDARRGPGRKSAMRGIRGGSVH